MIIPKLNLPACLVRGLFLAMGFFIGGMSYATTDVEMAGGSLSQQKILTAASEIRKLRGDPDAKLTRDQKNKSASTLFDTGLSAWRVSLSRTFLANSGFDTAAVKLFDAYVNYLVESKQPSVAIDALRVAVAEAARDKNYQWGVIYRIQLAELLVSIGQIELAQKSLAEAESLSERVYGKLTGDLKKPDPFHITEQAALISASIQTGGTVDSNRLSSFASIYESATQASTVIQFMTPMTPSNSVLIFGKNIQDDKYYRRDQEYWRWISIGALRVGDRSLAKLALEHMLKSADAASNNVFADDKEWRGDYQWQAKSYMSKFYLQPEHLRHQKFSDTAFSLETRFDSSLAGAEIYLMLDEPDEAKRLIDHATSTLGSIEKFSIELMKLGHVGLRVDQRIGELNRVTAKLYIKNGRWRDALVQLEKYLAWSEIYRNSLTLDERLPYFKGKSQGAYFDALLARASIFQSEPTEANFILALEAQENLKSRHLRDTLEASGKLQQSRSGFVNENMNSITRSGGAFLSIAEAGNNLIVFFADKDKKKIRIVRKPDNFARDILLVRNNLAERQIFDTVAARKIVVLALGELESLVFEKQKLVAEIDGSLSYLPIELWPNSATTPLGKNSVVSYIPSLAMAGVSRGANAAKGILAFGDAQFDKNQHLNFASANKESVTRGNRNGFSQLPETRDEVNAIMRNVKEGGKAVLGQEASKSQFFREAALAPYRYLHFATHGVVGGEVPLLNEPALVLTPTINDNGFLTATEISKMNISAELVVLSACNTGNGEYFNGEGLLGLGRAFIVAGAKAVVVSLWPVDSDTTKDMMIKFYRDLESTGDRSLALANARKSIIDRAVKSSKDTAKNKFAGHANPFYWAPFVLIESSL